jgi:hypothetical protein
MLLMTAASDDDLWTPCDGGRLLQRILLSPCVEEWLFNDAPCRNPVHLLQPFLSHQVGAREEGRYIVRSRPPSLCTNPACP